MIPIKQVLCIVLSAFLLFATVKVDLPEYSYVAKGRLESTFASDQGAALIPTYATFKVGRALMISARGMLQKGKSPSIPNVAVNASLMASDADVLDDAQLRANLIIWNEVVAPYLLKKDSSLERAVRDGGLMDEFLVPVPTSREYVGSAGDRAQKIQALISKSPVQIGDMLCTLSSLIDQRINQYGATAWTSDTGMCTDTSIKVNLVASKKSEATQWKLFNNSPNVAFDKGRTFTSGMMTASGVSDSSATISSVADLYEKIGQSLLFVAGNRYAADSDRVVLLGTACDKMGDGDGGCTSTQMGLAGAAKGIVASESYKGPADDRSWTEKAGDWMLKFTGYATTSILRIFLVVLSGSVKSLLPYAMGVSICVSFIASAIGIYRLLWPRQFINAMEWMIGPILYSSLWVVLNGFWTEIDTWLMFAASTISSFIADESAFATNVTSIVVSLGYLGIPFLVWSILWGSAGKALSRTTNFSARMVESGAAIGLIASKLGIGALDRLNKPSPNGSSGGAGGGGGAAGGAGAPPASTPPGSTPPPSSAPRSTGGGSGSHGSPAQGSGGSPKSSPVLALPAPATKPPNDPSSSGSGSNYGSGSVQGSGSTPPGSSAPGNSAPPGPTPPWDSAPASGANGNPSPASSVGTTQGRGSGSVPPAGSTPPNFSPIP